jgi:peptidoglycan hydrolase CwlO-like protein
MMELLTSSAFTALMAATIGSFATYLGTRTAKAPDIQDSLNAAVAGITKHYQEALVSSTTQIAALRFEIEALRKTVEAQTHTIEELETHITELTAEMRKAGVQPPPRRSGKSL